MHVDSKVVFLGDLVLSTPFRSPPNKARHSLSVLSPSVNTAAGAAAAAEG